MNQELGTIDGCDMEIFIENDKNHEKFLEILKDFPIPK